MAFTPTVQKLPAAPYREGDIFFCSYPKMGRTWVKQFLAQYMSLLFDLGYTKKFELESLMSIVPSEWLLASEPDLFVYKGDLRVPRVRFVHYQFGPMFVNMPVILLTRGIEDTLVSLYYPGAREETISECVRGRLGAVIVWLNGWWKGLPQTERFLHITYENMRENSAREFRAVVDFIGFEYNPEHFREALRRASFEQMKKDQGNATGARVRVRKGVVGGYRTDLSEEDVKFIQNTMLRHLHPEVWDALIPSGKRSRA